MHTKNFLKTHGEMADPLNLPRNDDELLERILAQYPGVTLLHDNIVWVWNKVRDEPWRDLAVRWYRGKNGVAKELADKYGHSHRMGAAVIANLSSEKDWNQNVNLAERLLRIRKEEQNTRITPEMRALIQKWADERIPACRAALGLYLNGGKGKNGNAVRRISVDDRLADLTEPMQQALFIRAHDEAFNRDRTFQIISPTGKRLLGLQVRDERTGKVRQVDVAWGSLEDIARAMRALKEDSLENISRSMAENHKVRSFYNNMISPDFDGDVTVDKDAMNVGLMHSLGLPHASVEEGLGTGGCGSILTGSNLIYALYADAYRRAAETISRLEGRRYLPSEVQAVASETVKSMFADAHRRAAETSVVREPIKNMFLKKFERPGITKSARDALGMEPDWDAVADMNPTVQIMRDTGIPLTRENYIGVKYGAPGTADYPEEWTWEHELGLPVVFQR
jgi:hypothetical protein